MNSKQRVMRAIDHKEPDRIPLDLVVKEEVKGSLLKYFKVDDWEKLLKKLNIDYRLMEGWLDYLPVKELSDGTFYDMWEIKRDKDYMPIGSPLKDATTTKQIESFKYADPDDIDYDKYVKNCEDASSAGYAVSGGAASCILNTCSDLMGMDRLMMQMIDNEELVELLFEKVTDFSLEVSKRIFEKAKNNIDICAMYDDYGGQDSLMISKTMWQRFVLPNIKRMTEQAKKYGYKTFQHSCGSVPELIPDLIDAGVDILDPVQPNAKGMDIYELNKKYGDKITFHGNIDTQVTLPMGSTEDVKNEVLKLIKDVASGGGLIIASSQSIQSDVPMENIEALYDTAYKYGNYNNPGKSI